MMFPTGIARHFKSISQCAARAMQPHSNRAWRNTQVMRHINPRLFRQINLQQNFNIFRFQAWQ